MGYHRLTEGWSVWVFLRECDCSYHTRGSNKRSRWAGWQHDSSSCNLLLQKTCRGYIAWQTNKCACWRRMPQLWVSVLHLVANFKTVELFNNTRKKGTSAFPLGHVSVLQHETPAAELTRGAQTDGGEHHQAVSECLPHTHALSQTYHKHPGQRKYTLADWCEKHRERRVL